MMHVVCQQEKNTCTFIYLTKCCQYILIQDVPDGTPIVEAYMVKISIKYQL